MIPPRDEKGVLHPRSPLRKWNHAARYNTAQECEVGKFTALDAKGNGSVFLASKCIATDDLASRSRLTYPHEFRPIPFVVAAGGPRAGYVGAVGLHASAGIVPAGTDPGCGQHRAGRKAVADDGSGGSTHPSNGAPFFAKATEPDARTQSVCRSIASFRE